MARIACLVVPHLPLQALLRADPALASAPVAVTEARAERTRRGAARAEPALTARVLAASRAAIMAGVRPGVTAAQARALCPDVVVRVAWPEQVAAARAALFDAALGFAPRVEPQGDAVLMEVGDLGRLYPREVELGLALVARVAHVGLEAGVGVASSKGVARVAAEAAAVFAGGDGAEALRLVPSGAEAAFLSPLPIAALPAAAGLDEKAAAEAIESLARWGVTTCGRLARLPGREVALRLGAPGARLHRLACGRCDEPLAARAPTDAIEEGIELDFALADLEALAFVLRGLIDRVLARLGARRLACGGLALRLHLEDGGHDVREVPLGAPTLDKGSLLALVRLDVERRPPGAGVLGVLLSARAACARPDQLDLFRPAGPAPDKLATTVARLQALLGEGAVGAPREVDTHREEEVAVGALQLAMREHRPAGPPTALPSRLPPVHGSSGAPVAGGTAMGVLALRRFRPEPELEVLTNGRTPRAISGAGLSCGVLVAAGPFRMQGEWWSERPFARDYWDVHASDGALYRIYRSAEGRWFLAGYYD